MRHRASKGWNWLLGDFSEGAKSDENEIDPNLKRNALSIVGSSLLTKTGDALANPKTVLTWMLGAVGAPEAVIGMLVPIRESGSMLPQIYLAQWIRLHRYRKGVWLVGCLTQGAAILGIAATGILLQGVWAGILVLLLLGLFSVARSLCSITSKDVLGKTMPKKIRGRITGLSASLSNFMVMAVGLLLILMPQTQSGQIYFCGLVGLAGCCWLIAAAIYKRIEEPAGEVEEDGERAGVVSRLKTLWSDSSFIHFVTARAFLLATALSAPYYVRIVQESSEGGLHWLGIFILAQGFAVGVSGVFWGNLSDRSSRLSMALGGALAALLGFIIGGFEVIAPSHTLLPWATVVGFFLLSVAHNGVRVGRKTYVVNLGEGNKRTDYVSTSNTIIGFLLLVTGTIGALSTVLGPGGILIVFAVCGTIGALLSARLPDVEAT
ncbi:MAG: MFS transporter [Candidatus Omnitrophica bacterium]|nr:MFS transporter [Candidatus Omnitrophota bacterium]